MIIYITIIQILIFLLLLYKDISKYNISLNLLVDRFIVKNIDKKDIMLLSIIKFWKKLNIYMYSFKIKSF